MIGEQENNHRKVKRVVSYTSRSYFGLQPKKIFFRPGAVCLLYRHHCGRLHPLTPPTPRNESELLCFLSKSSKHNLFHRIENNSSKINILHTKNLDVETDGLVVDVNHFDTGGKEVTEILMSKTRMLFCYS